MSLAGPDAFEISSLPVEGIESGTSILLTGADTAALESVFYRLLASQNDERTIVLATDADGRTVRRALDDVDDGVGDRTTVLTCAGPGRGEEITRIEDMGDLTKVGMEFSTLVANAQQETDRFRAGIYLCSSICSAVEDTRSVYRFLNSNFLTELRRGDGIGVCAIDTSADIGADVDSTVAGLETSFSGRIHVAESDGQTATLELSGFGELDGTADVTL